MSIFNTLAGDVGYATPNSSGIINLTADNGIETVASGSQVVYRFTPVAEYSGSEREFAQSAIRTTNATPTNIFNINLAEGEMVSIEARINAFRSNYSEAMVAKVITTARRAVGGNVTVIKSIFDILEDSSGDPDVTVSADIINQCVSVIFTGEIGKIYNVVASYEYHKTLTNV
jgi:hypothetical protein